jgi:hypothetical protein
MGNVKYRARYHSRVSKRFNLEGTELQFSVAGRGVVLTAQQRDLQSKKATGWSFEQVTRYG